MSAQWIEAGALMRGSLRRALTKAGVDFTETKGLLESVFVIHESPARYGAICRELRRQGVMNR